MSLTYRIGRFWFQNRSLSPLPFFLAFLLLPPQFQWANQPPALLYLCFLGVLLAEALRVISVGYAGSVTRTRGDVVPRLVHAGPFRWVRNPLYIGNTVMYSLAGVLFGFSTLSLALLVFSCVEYAFIVHYEETLLEETFGADYLEYKKHVNAWFPTIPPYKSSGHSFSLKAGLISEKSTFTAMGGMLLLWFIKTYYFPT